MPDPINNPTFQASLFRWVAVAAVIIGTSFAIVQYIRQPIANAVDNMADMQSAQQERIIKLEANYADILRRLESIDRKIQ